MRFNDSTCMISNAEFKKVKYIDPTAEDKEMKQGIVFTIGETPEKLAKKMKILTHYQRELENRKKEEDRKLSN